MTERIVKIGEMTYVDPKGMSRRAGFGATVDVHADNLERFDRFNQPPGGDDAVPEPIDPAPEPSPLGPTKTAAELEDEKPRRGRPRKAESE